jgi:hypothetical protein
MRPMVWTLLITASVVANVVKAGDEGKPLYRPPPVESGNPVGLKACKKFVNRGPQDKADPRLDWRYCTQLMRVCASQRSECAEALEAKAVTECSIDKICHE